MTPKFFSHIFFGKEKLFFEKLENMKNVDFENSIRLAQQLPNNTVKIAESGINDYKNIIELKKHGFEGFLIGENFMKSASPELKCKKFIDYLNIESNVIA